MICDLESAFGFTPGKDVHSSGIYSWRWEENHQHSWWGPRPKWGHLGAFEVSPLAVHGSQQVEVKLHYRHCSAPWSFSGKHHYHSPIAFEKPGCVWWENHLILLFTWFHMEWSKAPACLWKKSPRGILLRATLCKQMLLFFLKLLNKRHIYYFETWR